LICNNLFLDVEPFCLKEWKNVPLRCLEDLIVNMNTIDTSHTEYLCDIKAPCFQSLSSEEIELLQASKTQVLFRKGDNLTKQGAFSSYILFVVKGLAKQYIEGDATKDFNLKIVQPGEFLGLSAIFQDAPFQYSCSALTDCQAILIEQNAIKELLISNGSFGYHLTRRYCQQNSNLFNALQTILNKQMNGRIAGTLLYLNRLKTVHPDIFRVLTRKDLADFSGISTENTVKLLKSLEKDELIQLRDKDILILKPQALQDISKHG
jgi:CRP-like cAMP-binding protein